MASLKDITQLPVAESADGLNLIVNDNGAAKQIAASAVGAQADWNVEDVSSPAFIKNKPEVVQADWAVEDEASAAYIKNKPVEEWDLDLTCDITWNADTGAQNEPVFTAAEGYSYDAFVAKVESGDIPKVKFRLNQAQSADATIYFMDRHCNVMAKSGEMYGIFMFMGSSTPLMIMLNEDGTFTGQN